MEWAGKESVCLIPFGGGTSVTRALEVPPLEVEPRPVVSVDMRKVCFWFYFVHTLSVGFSISLGDVQSSFKSFSCLGFFLRLVSSMEYACTVSSPCPLPLAGILTFFFI